MPDTCDVAASPRTATRPPRRMAREPMTGGSELSTGPEGAKRSTKANLVRSLLQRPDGATIAQLVAATGWLPHTTRAALTGLRKKGYSLVSEKTDGIRRGWAAWKKLTTEQRSANPVERSHLVRLARLRFLAPDITAAIIEGRQPIELTARSLLRSGELPIAWADQRRVLGFA